MKNIGLLRLLVSHARLAQLVERQPFKLVVVGSSPTVGASLPRIMGAGFDTTGTTCIVASLV